MKFTDFLKESELMDSSGTSLGQSNKTYYNSLDEATSVFKSISAGWKKIIGSGSSVDMKAPVAVTATSNVHSESAFTKLLKDALSDPAKNPGVMLEINDVTVCGVFRNSEDPTTFYIMLPGGKYNKDISGKDERALDIPKSIVSVKDVMLSTYNKTLNSPVALADMFNDSDVTVKVIDAEAHEDDDDDDYLRSIKRPGTGGRSGGSGRGSSSGKDEKEKTAYAFSKERLMPIIKDIRDALPIEAEMVDLIDKAKSGKKVEYKLPPDVTHDIDDLNKALKTFSALYHDPKHDNKFTDSTKFDFSWYDKMAKQTP